MPAGCRIPIQSSNMYYPCGSSQPGRYSRTAVTFRYGFNGMEKNNELKGDGNSLDFGARMYDSRIGRFFALDPLSPDYPHNSPYAFSEIIAINAVELEGLEKSYAIDGSVIFGPRDLKPLNDRILNNTLEEYQYSMIARTNIRILTDPETDQKPYPLPDLKGKDMNLMTITASTEIGYKAKSKVKIFGIGYEGSIGISKILTEVTYTDKSVKTELYPGDVEDNSSIGVFAFSIDATQSMENLDNNSTTTTLAPFKTTFSPQQENTMLTILEIAQTAIVGGSLGIYINPRALMNTGTIQEDSNDLIAPADKTRVEVNTSL